jgi:hypothetical protein
VIHCSHAKGINYCMLTSPLDCWMICYYIMIVPVVEQVEVSTTTHYRSIITLNDYRVGMRNAEISRCAI